MAHPVLRNLLLQRIASARASANEMSGLSHLGLRGRAREIFVTQLLSPLLLPGQIVGTGVVVDSRGGQSSQSDIIIFDRTILPPELFNVEEGVFPVEACIYAIEVKSCLTKQELDDAVTKGKKLFSLEPLSPMFYPIPALFAFSSDLKMGGMEQELDRLLKLEHLHPDYPPLRVVCIAGKGYAYFEDRMPKRHWRFLESDEGSQEVVDFLSGFANTLPDFRKNRALYTPFGEYVSTDRKFTPFLR